MVSPSAASVSPEVAVPDQPQLPAERGQSDWQKAWREWPAAEGAAQRGAAGDPAGLAERPPHLELRCDKETPVCLELRPGSGKSLLLALVQKQVRPVSYHVCLWDVGGSSAKAPWRLDLSDRSSQAARVLRWAHALSWAPTGLCFAVVGPHGSLHDAGASSRPAGGSSRAPSPFTPVYLWRVYDTPEAFEVAGLYDSELAICGPHSGGKGQRASDKKDSFLTCKDFLACPWHVSAACFCDGGRSIALVESVAAHSGEQRKLDWRPRLIVFDVETREQMHQVVVPEEVRSLSYIPQSSRLVIATKARVILWASPGRNREGEGAAQAALRARCLELCPCPGLIAAPKGRQESWTTDVLIDTKEEKVGLKLDKETLLVKHVRSEGPVSKHGIECGKHWLLVGYKEVQEEGSYAISEGRKEEHSPFTTAQEAFDKLRASHPLTLVFQRPLGDTVFAECYKHKNVDSLHCAAVSPDGTCIALAMPLKEREQKDGVKLEISIWSVESSVPWRIHREFAQGPWSRRDTTEPRQPPAGGRVADGKYWSLAWVDVYTLLVSNRKENSLTAISVASGEMEQRWSLTPASFLRMVSVAPSPGPRVPGARAQPLIAAATELVDGSCCIELGTSWTMSPGEAAIRMGFKATNSQQVRVMAPCSGHGDVIALAGATCYQRAQDDGSCKMVDGEPCNLLDGEVRILKFATMGAVTQHSLRPDTTAEGRQILKHVSVHGRLVAVLLQVTSEHTERDSEARYEVEGSMVMVFMIDDDMKEDRGLPRKWEWKHKAFSAISIHHIEKRTNDAAAKCLLAVGPAHQDGRAFKICFELKKEAQHEDLEELTLATLAGTPRRGEHHRKALLQFSPVREKEGRRKTMDIHLLGLYQIKQAVTIQMWKWRDIEKSLQPVARGRGPAFAGNDPGHEIPRMPENSQLSAQPCLDMCWLADNKHLRVAYGITTVHQKHKQSLQVIDIDVTIDVTKLHAKVIPLEGDDSSASSAVTSLRLSLDGKVLVTGGKHGNLRFYVCSQDKDKNDPKFTQLCCAFQLPARSEILSLALPGLVQVTKKGNDHDMLSLPSRVACITDADSTSSASGTVVVYDLRSLSSHAYAHSVHSMQIPASKHASDATKDFFELLEASPCLLHQRLLRHEHSWTLFHLLAFGCNLGRQVHRLLDLGAAQLALDASRRSGIDIALSCNHFKVVDTVLEHMLKIDKKVVRHGLPSEHLALSKTVVRLLRQYQMVNSQTLVGFLEECCCEKPHLVEGSTKGIPEAAKLWKDENVCSFPAPLFMPDAPVLKHLVSEDLNERRIMGSCACCKSASSTSSRSWMRWKLLGRTAGLRPVEVKVWYLRGLDCQVGLTRALALTRKAPEFLRTEFATTVLYHKWINFARTRFRKDLAKYIGMLLVFVFFCASGRTYIVEPENAFNELVFWLCKMGLLASSARSIYQEGTEILKERAVLDGDQPDDFIEVLASYIEGFVSYISMWNALDLSRIFLLFISTVGSILSAASFFEGEGGRTVLSLTAIVFWFRLLSFFRGFQYTSDLVLTVVTISKDVVVVFLLLGVAVMAFTHAMFIFFNYSDVEGFVEAFMYVWVGGIIGDPPDRPEEFEGNYVAHVLYIMLTIIVLVVYMNFLIAFMGDSFNKAREDLDAAKNEMRAELVCEYEDLDDFKEDDARTSSYIFICRQVRPDPEVSPAEKVASLEKAMNEKLGKVTKSISGLESKLEQLLILSRPQPDIGQSALDCSGTISDALSPIRTSSPEPFHGLSATMPPSMFRECQDLS